MEYCYHISAGFTYSSLGRLDRFKSDHAALWVMNCSPLCNPHATEYTLLTSRYSSSVTMTDDLTRSVLSVQCFTARTVHAVFTVANLPSISVRLLRSTVHSDIFFFRTVIGGLNSHQNALLIATISSNPVSAHVYLTPHQYVHYLILTSS